MPKKFEDKCNISNSMCKEYIEQTGKTLDLQEHRRALVSHSYSFSAVAEHALSEKHGLG